MSRDDFVAENHKPNHAAGCCTWTVDKILGEQIKSDRPQAGEK